LEEQLAYWERKVRVLEEQIAEAQESEKQAIISLKNGQEYARELGKRLKLQ